MDLTPLEHAAIAVILTVIGWACGDIYYGFKIVERDLEQY